MNKKALLLTPLVLLLLGFTVLACGCSGQTENSMDAGINSPPTSNSSVEKVEIYHFHATRQCYSCITLGAYAEETVNTYFSSENESGKIVFAHINFDLPENRLLVERYEPTGSSLWIGVYDGEGFHKEENNAVWYKIGNKDEYMAYLKELIEKRLAGDYS
ncbi:MAG TPA: nitrophenyl compound nitroreductase subunit ArsF family protein [Methanoregulaceae archaeon]|nr:nitrophenyl compound nitroreductase subunit ArsF family protein [Methanoregulaceae archaeon]